MPARACIRLFRFFQLGKFANYSRAGWYWQEVNEYGYALARATGPFPSYDAAFLAAGEDVAPESPEERAMRIGTHAHALALDAA